MSRRRGPSASRTRRRLPGARGTGVFIAPARVEPVATAIPAFVGWTHHAQMHVPGDLLRVPTRIDSLAEYQQHFGEAPPESALRVEVAETTDGTLGPVEIHAAVTVTDGGLPPHTLFHCLQLYFANGGGACFVVSAGGFAQAGEGLRAAELITALDTLETVDEPTLLVIPEAQNLPSASDFAAVAARMLRQCERLGDRFALLDVHGARTATTGSALMTAVDEFRSTVPGLGLDRGAAFAPNLETGFDREVDETRIVVDHVRNGAAAVSVTLDQWRARDDRIYFRARAALRAFPLRLPPSAAVAALCCRTDRDSGVWKAPVNEPLVEVLRPAVEITDEHQQRFTVDPGGTSINAIRTRQGRGAVVWGARTLAGTSEHWRYLNVRRFALFVEESISETLEQLTLDPADPATWASVQSLVEDFLTSQWRAGALQGVKREQAFFVAVGPGRTMSERDVEQGHVIVEIGLAILRPAEFIVLRVSRTIVPG